MVKEGDTFEIKSYEDLKPGRWIKPGHLLGKECSLTIAKIWGECTGKNKDGVEQRTGVLSFEETELHLRSPKTVDQLLNAMFGADPSVLPGKVITLVPDKDKFGREIVDCIRLSGSPQLEATIQKTVKYAKKTGRPDKKFTLRNTKGVPMGLPGDEEEEPAPTEEQLQQALAAVAGSDAENRPAILASLREKRWTKEQGLQIRAAVEAVSSNTLTVDE